MDDLEWIGVDSSNIFAVAYEYGSVYVKFISGDVYEYCDVPPWLFFIVFYMRIL